MATPVPDFVQPAPYGIELEPGKDYWFCACGKSKSQPWVLYCPYVRNPLKPILQFLWWLSQGLRYGSHQVLRVREEEVLPLWLQALCNDAFLVRRFPRSRFDWMPKLTRTHSDGTHKQEKGVKKYNEVRLSFAFVLKRRLIYEPASKSSFSKRTTSSRTSWLHWRRRTDWWDLQLLPLESLLSLSLCMLDFNLSRGSRWKVNQRFNNNLNEWK